MIVKLPQVLLRNGIAWHTHVVCDDLVLGAQMGSFDTPADLAENSRHITLYSGLIIKSMLFRRHLVTQEPCIGRLVDTIIWLLDCLVECIIEAFRMLRTQLLWLTH